MQTTWPVHTAYAAVRLQVEARWNVMAHAQKPDFVFRRNERVHLNRWGASDQAITGSRVVRISGSNAGYTMFRGSVKGTDYTLHSPVSPSLPLPCVTVCHPISTEVYYLLSKFYSCSCSGSFCGVSRTCGTSPCSGVLGISLSFR